MKSSTRVLIVVLTRLFGRGLTHKACVKCFSKWGQEPRKKNPSDRRNAKKKRIKSLINGTALNGPEAGCKLSGRNMQMQMQMQCMHC